jgi:hypothetical protein
MVNIKPYIFFGIIFSIILVGYFNYNLFIQYIPIGNFIKFFVLILGIGALFFPEIISKLRSGEDYENIKKFIIEKYKIKNKK